MCGRGALEVTRLPTRVVSFYTRILVRANIFDPRSRRVRSMMSGCPTADEFERACARLNPRSSGAGAAAGVGTAAGTAAEPVEVRGTVPMRSVAQDGIGIVSRLMESLEKATREDASGPVLEYPEDVPIFTFSHESRLLTECYPFPLADGTVAEMLPCARGSECLGTSKQLEGHDASGGVVLRGLLTPEELTCFEQTGKNPEGPRLCVMCARVCVSEAYFETQDAQFERVTRGVCFNFYGNLRGCREGYKREHTIPIGSCARWNGLIAPVACNALNKMRLVRRGGVWTVDQRELGFADASDATHDRARHFR